MKDFKYEVTINLNIASSQIQEISNEIEVSMPCVNCKRSNKTIRFEDVNIYGTCTPKKKCKEFLGVLRKKEIIKQGDSVGINCLITFKYEPFIDSKYKVNSNMPFINWARQEFTVKCSHCNHMSTISTQENMKRPREVECECGNIIYQEFSSPFSYKLEEIP